MGDSDRHHFAWICGALQAFEAQTGRLSAIGSTGSQAPTLWSLAEQRMSPPVEYIRTRLGHRTELVLCDLFPKSPGVRTLDINQLDDVPDHACDVVTLFRASYFIADPAKFLESLRRLLRPGGVAIIDWLHGLSDAPMLDLTGDPRYGGGSTPFLTTYIDATFPVEFAAEFDALLRHVNRPPWWCNMARPGASLPARERLRHLLCGTPRRSVSRATYEETLRGELRRAGKNLIEPPLLESYFKVVFRHARYFYPRVRKFNLYLLTVLEPR
jgi:SAM-dependent methyltransferase